MQRDTWPGLALAPEACPLRDGCSPLLTRTPTFTFTFNPNPYLPSLPPPFPHPPSVSWIPDAELVPELYSSFFSQRGLSWHQKRCLQAFCLSAMGQGRHLLICAIS